MFAGSSREFQDYVRTMELDRGFTEKSILQECLLLGEEVGELFKAIRKHVEVGVDASDDRDANPAHEIADILIVLASIANRLDIDMAEAIRDKEAINAHRTWL